MRMKNLLAVTAFAALIVPAIAAAATLDVSINTAPYVFASFDTSGAAIAGDVANNGGDQVTNNDTPFWTATYSFNLTSANQVLTITDLSADDIVGVELNGNLVAAAGIFAPGPGGQGTFYPTPTSPGELLTGVLTNGPQSVTSTGLFSVGANTIELIIDNTNNGVDGGGLTGGPSSVAFSGSISPAGVPEPASWAMMLVGFGGLGAAMRSRRKQVATT
jgi:hypothetical protein